MTPTTLASASCLSLLLSLAVHAGGTIAVVAHEPMMNAGNVGCSASISVTFDAPVDPGTVTGDTFWAFGRWSGTATGTISLSRGNTVLTLVPHAPFSAGELVTVFLAESIGGGAGTLRDGGYCWQFWTRTGRAEMGFAEFDTMSTRITPGEDARSYGGTAPDLNNDGFLDLAIVNEVSEDVRVFLNSADGSGLFQDFLQPTNEVDTQASPSETGDFDRDGNTDLVVSNTIANTISILLGNGDGTFRPQQLIPTQAGPYGQAVLDVDGDADQDLVIAHWQASSMGLLINDGNGVFSDPTFFEGDGTSERACFAADMDEDGLLDIVIGAQDSQEIIVRVSDGNGTFTLSDEDDIGGGVRMIATGDVDGDGHVDIAAALGQTDRGAIVFGEGNGLLQNPAVIYVTGDFTGATDLGDLDGDGDMDWSVSNFLGDWQIFENDGAGVFTLVDSFPAPQVASCTILFDMDGDADLDIAQVDEFEDVVILMQNVGSPVPGDADGDGEVDVIDLLAILSEWGPCGGCPEDVNGDEFVNTQDLLVVLLNFGS